MIEALRPFLGSCIQNVNIIAFMQNTILEMNLMIEVLEKCIIRNDAAQVNK